MRKYRIGVDLGGTNIAAGIVDEEFSIVKKASVKTDVAGGAEKICRDIDSLCRSVCAEAGIPYEEAIAAVGVGSPGIIRDGVVINADNLRFSGVPLAAMLEKLTGKPVPQKQPCGDGEKGKQRGDNQFFFVLLHHGAAPPFKSVSQSMISSKTEVFSS